MATAPKFPGTDAGLPATQKPLTPAEKDELLSMLATSDVVAQHREGRAAAVLAIRERQVEEIEVIRRLGDENAESLFVQITRARAKVGRLRDQLTEAVAELASLDAEFGSVCGSRDVAIANLERALERTADPRIDQFIERAHVEVEIVRGYDAPFVTEYDPRSGRETAGFDQDIRAVLVDRIEALHQAIDHARALRLRADLSSDAVVAELRRIREAVPPIPNGALERIVPRDLKARGFAAYHAEAPQR